MFTQQLLGSATIILQFARAKAWKITSAESCTGGLISALFTEIAGSSNVFTHGFITYSNVAKTEMIGVDASLIATHGAVSEVVAIAMAEGAQQTADADISIAVTGIAGPGGATINKPVGLVHIASSRRNLSTLHRRCVFTGDRHAVRMQAVAAALELLQQQFSQ